MDVPAEAFGLMALAVGLWVWRRALGRRPPENGDRHPAQAANCRESRLDRGPGASPLFPPACVTQAFSALGLSLVVGLLAGLAALTKLNGGLAMMVLSAWGVLGLALGGFAVRRRLALAALTAVEGVTSLAAFVVLNPFLYAHPTGPPPPRMMAPAPVDQSVGERLVFLIRHRAQVSRDAARIFPHDALTTLGPKLATVAVQGFGRFGPFGPRDHDSTVPYPRYSWSRDVSAVVWLPLVLLGAGWAVVGGMRSIRRGEPPVAWAVLGYFAVTLATVSAFLPLAWDRYLLPIQAPSALLVAGATRVGASVGSITNSVRGLDA